MSDQENNGQAEVEPTEEIQVEHQTQPNGRRNGKKYPKWALVLSILIPSVSTAGAAWYGFFAGDPEARKETGKSYETLSRAFNNLNLAVAHMRGQMQGAHNAKLMKQIEELRKENQKLQGNVPVSTDTKVATKPVVEIPKGPKVGVRKLKPCPPGWVRIKGTCTKSRAKIAKEVADTRAKLKKEKGRRKVLEAKKAMLQKQVQAQKTLRPRPAPAPAPPPMLPTKLEEAKTDK